MKRLLIQDTGALEVEHLGYTLRSAGEFRVALFAPPPDFGYIGEARDLGDAKKIVEQMEGRR